MSKTKNTKKTKAKEDTQEVQAEVAAPKAERIDTKAKHKSEAVAKARAAFKALGLEAPKAFDAIENGKATEADYKSLKESTDSLSKAVNALGLHVGARKEAAAKG